MESPQPRDPVTEPAVTDAFPRVPAVQVVQVAGDLLAQALVSAAAAVGAAQQSPRPEPPLVDLSPIVAAAQQTPIFAPLSDVVPGAGLGAKGQELPVELARDGAAADAASALSGINVGYSLPLLALEIIRDFWQILSLVISFAFTAPFDVTVFFGNFAFVCSLDFFLLVPYSINISASYTVVWWILFVLVLVLMVMQEKTIADAVLTPGREFGMCRTWSSISRKTAWRLRALNFVLTLLYLPVSQMSLEVILCSHRYKNRFGTCPEWPYWISGVIMILVLTLFLPFRLIRLITNNVPKQREFDVVGEPMRLRLDAEYRADVASIARNNPIAPLFYEYRRPMRYHKVSIMALKLYLIIIAVGLSGNSYTGFKPAAAAGNTTVGTPTRLMAETPADSYNHARPALLIIGLATYALVCVFRPPFMTTLGNALDISLRLLALLTVVLAWPIMFNTGVKECTALMLVVLSLTLLVSIVFFIASFDAVQEKARIALGDVVLTETSPDDPTPLVFNPDRIDLVRERKVRVWQHFWNVVLFHVDPYRFRATAFRDIGKASAVIMDGVGSEASQHGVAADSGVTAFEYVDGDDTIAYLLDFKASVAERHHENVEIARDVGSRAFRLALQPLSEHDTLMSIATTRTIHGLDCYWAPEGNDGAGTFGCLFLMPVPVEGFFFPDEEGDELRLPAPGLSRLLNLNMTPEIRRRRQVRQWLRALEVACLEHKREVYFVHQTEKTIQVPDGVDHNGKAKYKNVTVNVTFTHGRFSVERRYATPQFIFPDPQSVRRPELDAEHPPRQVSMTPGFQVRLTYAKGSYNEHGGGEVGEETIGHAELGVLPTYETTSRLRTLLEGNQDLLALGLPTVLLDADVFRRYFMSEFLAKSLTLSYAFWPEVVNNDSLSFAALRERIKKEENALVKELATTDVGAGLLRTLFARMRYFNSCPAVAIWVCFWHDLYYQNIDMSILVDDETVSSYMNPFRPTAFAWNVMSQSCLTELLVKVGLQTEPGKGFIQRQLIDSLYASMAKSMVGFSSQGHATVMASVVTEDDVGSGALAEVQHHELYAKALSPFLDGTAHPLLAAVIPDDHDCYTPITATDAMLAHYQKYAIVHERVGGYLPPDYYAPRGAV